MEVNSSSSSQVGDSSRSLRRLMLIIGGVMLFITLYAAWRGPDCSSGTTDQFSPDLKDNQLKYLKTRFPEDFENRVRADEELLKILHFTDLSTEGHARVFLDIGANVGRVSFGILSEWGQQRTRDSWLRFKEVGAELSDKDLRKSGIALKDPEVHAFEIDSERYENLQKVSKIVPENKLVVNYLAVSDKVGEAKVFSSDEGPTLGKGTFQDTVSCTTVDEYMRENGITKTKLVKIDVEGFEPLVLAGMKESLSSGAVKMFLMSYGHKWRKDHTGRDQDFTLKEVTRSLNRLRFDCYLVSKHRLLKVNGDYWDDEYELHAKFKYVTVDVWCVKHDFWQRNRIVTIYNNPFQIDDYFD